jgi:hypothetical protein
VTSYLLASHFNGGVDWLQTLATRFNIRQSANLQLPVPGKKQEMRDFTDAELLTWVSVSPIRDPGGMTGSRARTALRDAWVGIQFAATYNYAA